MAVTGGAASKGKGRAEGEVGRHAMAMERVPAPVVARAVIVDDHPMVRGAIGQALAEDVDAGAAGTGAVAVREASDLDGLRLALVEEPDLDLVLLDLSMPGVSGLTGLMGLRAEHPALPVVIVSATSDGPTVSRAMRLGASGFVPKSARLEEIREAVGTVLRGGVWQPGHVEPEAGEAETEELMARLETLTPQQSRVLTMVARGLLNKQIAYELAVSEATVKAHVSAVLSKLRVDSRTQAVIALNRLGGSPDG